MKPDDVFAVIDPRDGHELEYFHTRDRAADYADWLKRSACHPYRDIDMIVRQVRP
jgi:hypothetical protein